MRANIPDRDYETCLDLLAWRLREVTHGNNRSRLRSAVLSYTRERSRDRDTFMELVMLLVSLHHDK